MIKATKTNQADTRIYWRNMHTELFLFVLIAALIYGLINSTEKVLILHERHNEESRNLLDHRSRM